MKRILNLENWLTVFVCLASMKLCFFISCSVLYNNFIHVPATNKSDESRWYLNKIIAIVNVPAWILAININRLQRFLLFRMSGSCIFHPYGKNPD
jgi:hypothetical protein